MVLPVWVAICVRNHWWSCELFMQELGLVYSRAKRCTVILLSCLYFLSNLMHQHKRQGYSLKSTEIRSYGRMLVSLAAASFSKVSTYLSWMECFRLVGGQILFFISSWHHFCRLVADSYFIKWCNSIRYTLENILVYWRIKTVYICCFKYLIFWKFLMFVHARLCAGVAGLTFFSP